MSRVESDYIEESREIYQNAGSEYQRYYFDEDTGGFVLIHQEHKLTDSELFVAETFAGQGSRVKLLGEQNLEGIKTPDAELDGEFWEFKELRNAINVRGAVQQDIREGKKQARNIAYHINQDFNIVDINAGIQTAIRFDENRLVQQITLIFRTGSFKTLTRSELENGEGF